MQHEAHEQEALFQWANYQKCTYPELGLLYAVPNGGSRNIIEAANLKKQGVKAGVPDICLPVAKNGFNGLYIELKRETGGQVSKEQGFWIENLRKQGYHAVVCKGWKAAVDEILFYMGIAKAYGV